MGRGVGWTRRELCPFFGGGFEFENAGFYRNFTGAGTAANFVGIGRTDSAGTLVDGVRITGGGDENAEASHNGYFNLEIRNSGNFRLIKVVHVNHKCTTPKPVACRDDSGQCIFGAENDIKQTAVSHSSEPQVGVCGHIELGPIGVFEKDCDGT